MKIAFDISPLSNANNERGVGAYTKNLKGSLEKYFSNNTYFFVNSKKELVEDVDIFHIPFFDPYFITLPVKKKYKTIVTIHDLIPVIFPEHFPSGIKGAIKWQIQKRLLKKVDAIITDSESSKKDIIKKTSIKAQKIRVVYLAHGEKFIPIKDPVKLDAIKKKYSLPEKFLLYVGDATWNKNLPNIIEASAKSNIPLILVGKTLANKKIELNPWNHDLSIVVKKIDNRNIRALGFVPEEDLAVIYNLATVLLMPSLYEGFGLPVLEAMAAGCPVITSKKGSLEEVAGDAAILVDPMSYKDIARAAIEVSENNMLREKLIKKGLIQASKFSWKKTVSETIKIYEEINS